ncbi:putative calcium-binding protein [SAR116 cluster alpha proteobacterium HIMB100]|nr:putative calcium-binding protein [SAR116 cluster alpha proteobacterium HIMB100]
MLHGGKRQPAVTATGRDIIDGGDRWSTLSYADFVVSPDDMTGVHIDLSVSADKDGFRAVERHHTDPKMSDLVRGLDHIEGSKFNDRLTGDNRVNFLKGQNGNDILSGNGGNDTLRGGFGDDTLNVGGGADRLFGEKGQDVLTRGGGADKFSLSIITKDSYDDTNTILDFDQQEGDRVVVPTMNAPISKMKINSVASAADKEIRIMFTAATEQEGGGANLTFTYHDPTFDLNTVFLCGVDHSLITQDTVEDWFDVYRDVTISSDVL